MEHNILIVDDSATMRALIRRAITLSGAASGGRIHEAPDGQAALDLIGAQPVDLVFADLNMPRMGGVEMTTRLRQNPSTCNLPVVVVSSESMEGKIAALKAQGIRGYIKKPFTPEQIRDVIQLLMGASHAA